MTLASTVRELLSRQAITDEQVNSIVATYLANPKAGLWRIAGGVNVDIASAVEDLGWTTIVAANGALGPVARRVAVRMAILLARPA